MHTQKKYALNDTVNKMYLLLSFISIFGIVFIITREAKFSTTTILMWFQLSILFFTLLIAFFKKRIKLEIKIIWICIVLFCFFIVGIYSVGYLTSHKVYLLVIPLFLAFIVKHKHGLFILGFMLVVYVAFGYLHINEILLNKVDTSEYVVSLKSWILDGVILAVFALFILLFVQHYDKILQKYINNTDKLNVELAENRDRLLIKNEQLAVNSEKLEKSLQVAERALKMKSNLLTNSSHVLRTPLTVIKSSVGFLFKYWDKMDDDIKKEKLLKIDKQTELLTNILNELILAGKMEDKGLKCSPKLINIKEFIEPIIVELEVIFNNSHRIILEIENTDHNLFIDQRFGKRLFINLLTNAIKFSPKSDKVICKIKNNESDTYISFIDFGIGINKDGIEDLFIPFWKSENDLSINGFGLGMSIVKDIVDMHFGEITIESELDKGTNITIRLPNKRKEA